MVFSYKWPIFNVDLLRYPQSNRLADGHCVYSPDAFLTSNDKHSNAKLQINMPATWSLWSSVGKTTSQRDTGITDVWRGIQAISAYIVNTESQWQLTAPVTVAQFLLHNSNADEQY